MSKALYLFLLFISVNIDLIAQTICVSGQCIDAPITLSKIADVNGKSAYQAVGRVAATDNVTVSVYWLSAPDNVWVLDFDGQPYFSNSCDLAEPPITTNLSCSWVAVVGTSCTGSAALGVFNTSCSVLPVTFISIAVKEENGKAVLQWKTANETNNKGFFVQRSSDGIIWSDLGFVNGNGTSSGEHNYSFTDAGASGKLLYRVKQVDLDGKFAFSPTASIRLNTEAVFTVRNSPGTGLFELVIPASTGETEIHVLDMNGRTVRSLKVQPGVIPVDLRDRSAGVYILRAKYNNGTFNTKLVKQ